MFRAISEVIENFVLILSQNSLNSNFFSKVGDLVCLPIKHKALVLVPSTQSNNKIKSVMIGWSLQLTPA